MRILIVTPAMSPPHGGLRIVNEWANRLSDRHDVRLFSIKPGKSDWFEFSGNVRIQQTYNPGVDCLVVTSPHGVSYSMRHDRPKRVFMFMQMLEHLFNPSNSSWKNLCRKFYRSPHHLITISRWNERELRRLGRKAPTHYVGNGVNLSHFPIDRSPKDGKTVLIEGWECCNSTKDVEKIAPRVAKRLQTSGYRTVAYSQLPATSTDGLDEYYHRPSLARLNELYRRATILVKASRYDARACAPVEAMTKGTVTARAIIEGDDDLVHDVNALRCGYNEDELYSAAMTLLTDTQRRERLAQAALDYVQTYSWDYWMPKIDDILCNA